MKKILLCLLLALTFSAFASCSREPDVFNVYYPVREQLKSLDPQITTGDSGKIIALNTFEGLISIDENGVTVPAAAESYEVSDAGLKYTFYLNKDARWRISNSVRKALEGKLPEKFDTRVTAHDFVFALRRAIAPETRADDAVLLSAIVNAKEIMAGNLAPEHLGVRAVSDYVFEINLEYAQPNFLETLALPIAMPCNQIFFDACGGRYGLSLNYIITNGPFYLSRWREDYSLRLTKNADYSGKRQGVAEGAYLYVNTDSQDILAKLNSNDYNAAYLRFEEFQNLKKAEEYVNLVYENELWAFCFNNESELFSNKSLRRAISLSVNLDVMQDFWQKEQADRYLPPFCQPKFQKGFEASRPAAFDEKMAQDELKIAFTEMEKTAIEVTLLCALEHEQMLRMQMQEWQRVLGVDINIWLSPLPFEELKHAISTKNYDFAFYSISTVGKNVQDFFRMFLSNSSLNITNMKDNNFDEKFNELLRSENESIFKIKAAELEGYLAEQMVYLPAFYEKNYLVMNRNVEGYKIHSSPDMVYFTYAKYKENK